MAFEVFDDVAFYYLCQSLLAIFLLPPTTYVIVRAIYRKFFKKPEEKYGASISDYEEKGTLIVDELTFSQKYLKPKYILFGFLWIVFLYQCTQFGHYQMQKLTTFDPIDILELEPTATADEIKASYRKLSLKWHPDKNPDNREEAEEKFIMISKAYKTLTDSKAKANLEKFGNADGYQGTSVTIGLPSMLTKPENHLKILLLYFLLFIMLPPALVFMWWKKAGDINEYGVHQNTFYAYWHMCTEHMSPKFLIPVLAASQEYKVLDELNNSQEAEKDRKKLMAQVEEYMAKTKLSKLQYVVRGSILLHAYLLRIPIPETLQPDLKVLLKDAHRFLNVMTTVCVARKYVKASMACIELSQMLSQAMWPTFSPLLQLPFLTQREIRLAGKKRLDTLENFKAASQETREKVYKDHTKEEWEKINKVCDMLPDMKMDAIAGVEDEEGIFEGDFVCITITLERNPPEAIETDADATEKTAESTDEDGKDIAVQNTEKTTAKLLEELDDDELDKHESELLETMPFTGRESSLSKLDNGPLVHAPFYTWPIHEKWVVFLYEKTKNKTLRMLNYAAVPNFVDKQTIKMHMRMGEKGVYPYELHAKCNSYVGCDVVLSFKITVAKMTKAEEEKRDALFERGKLNGLDDDEDDDDEEEEEEEGQWYYLGFASFWEMVLNLIVLILLGVFVVNFLQTRGYWDKYFQPPIDKVWKVIEPVYNTVWPIVEPVMRPLFMIWDAFSALVVVDPEKLAEAKFKQDL